MLLLRFLVLLLPLLLCCCCCCCCRYCLCYCFCCCGSASDAVLFVLTLLLLLVLPLLLLLLPARLSQRYGATVVRANSGGSRTRCRSRPPCGGARPRLLSTVRPGLPHGDKEEDASGQKRRRYSSQVGRIKREGGSGVVITVHGCSRMTIDPRTPTMPGRRARRVFTDQAGIASTKREAP